MDTLYASLGQFYFTTHSNAPPTFIQVIGWTKGAERPEAKRRYVYVRKVPFILQHGYGGGKWEFDDDAIKQYATEITEPIHNPKAGDGNAIVIDGAHFLRYHSITVPLKQFDFAPIQIPVPSAQEKLSDEEPQVDITLSDST